MEEHDKGQETENQSEMNNEEDVDVTEEEVEIITEDTSEDSSNNNEELDAVKEEKEQLQDRLLRLQAEYENFKRRTEKERIAERKYKSEEVVTALLPVLDNFERAMQTEVTEENKGFVDGIQMVYNQFTEALESQGVEAIDTVEQEFDPNLHHAVMQVEEEELASNIVVEELQKGFLLKDKVIRPAMVKVNK